MKIKTWYLNIFFILNLMSTNAQTPLNDNSWSLNSDKSDEFNNSTLDSKWNILTKYDGWGQEHYRAENVILDGSNLKLRTDRTGGKPVIILDKPIMLSKADKIIKTEKIINIDPITTKIEYWTGGIVSKVDNYHYGYYEIKAKIPKGKGFWTAFWLHASKGNGLSYEWYDEIDILEPSGCHSESASKCNVGYWDWTGVYGYTIEKTEEMGFVHETGIDLSLAEHKYAVEWLPGYLIFYVDDYPIFRRFNDGRIPSHPLLVFINQEISWWPCNPTNETDEKLPEYFEINYFRYYELNTDDINIRVTQIPNFNTYKYSVKKSISLSSSTYIPADGRRITLRANEYIELQSGFQTTLGTEIVFAMTPNM